MINISTWCKTSIEELQEYKTPKDELLEKYIKLRLDKSYNNYNQELEKCLDYLSRRNELNVTKKLNRMNKQK